MSLLETRRDPSAREARRFTGLALPAVLGLLGLVLLWRGSSPAAPMILFGATILAALGGLGSVAVAKLVHRAVARITYPIGWAVSHLVLVAVYFLVLTPVALLVRRLGHDPLRRGLDRAATSYWDPFPPVRGVRDYFRQF